LKKLWSLGTKKNKELGERVQNHYKKLIIEKEDAAMVEEGKKLTLYKWANSKVTKVEKDENGNVKEIHVNLTPEDKDFKKTQICHWIPFKEGLYTKVILVEYGHLINVKKFEDNMKIEDIVNNNSKFETPAFAESIILQAKKGDKIQFERRGYFIVDKLPENDKPMYLIYIPDGKTKSQSIISGKVDAKVLNTGDKDDKNEAKKKAKKEAREEKKKKKEEKKAKKAEEKHKKEEEGKKDDEKKRRRKKRRR
jgi:glutamyl-tRNA synthetase